MATAAGPHCRRRRGPIRLAVSFGAFQGLMPLLGALTGAYLLVYVRAYDHWVAFGLLELIGAKMLFEALRPRRTPEPDGAPARSDPSAGWTLLGLSVATSIDAFGAGVGMHVARANLWLACPLIAGVTAGLTYLGARVGATAVARLGRSAEVVGGLVLIALGIRMLQI